MTRCDAYLRSTYAGMQYVFEREIYIYQTSGVCFINSGSRSINHYAMHTTKFIQCTLYDFVGCSGPERMI